MTDIHGFEWPEEFSWDDIDEFEGIKRTPETTKTNICPNCDKTLNILYDRKLCKNCGLTIYHPYVDTLFDSIKPLRGCTYNRNYHVNKLLKECNLPKRLQNRIKHYFIHINRQIYVRYGEIHMPKLCLIFNLILNHIIKEDKYINYFTVMLKEEKIKKYNNMFIPIIKDILKYIV